MNIFSCSHTANLQAGFVLCPINTVVQKSVCWLFLVFTFSSLRDFDNFPAQGVNYRFLIVTTVSNYCGEETLPPSLLERQLSMQVVETMLVEEEITTATIYFHTHILTLRPRNPSPRILHMVSSNENCWPSLKSQYILKNILLDIHQVHPHVNIHHPQEYPLQEYPSRISSSESVTSSASSSK